MAPHLTGQFDGVLLVEDEHMDHADRVRSLYLDPTVTGDLHFDTTIDPDLDGSRRYVTGTWEVPEETVDRVFERLATSTPLSL